MTQSLAKKSLLSRVGGALVLVVTLAMAITPAFAQAPVVIATSQENVPPAPLLAMADPPDFLAPAPTCPKEQGEEGKAGAITPFIGPRQVLTLLPTPERPAIASDVVPPLERPEVMAGVDVDLGTVELNFGYTLPSSKVDNFIRPFGVELEPGSEAKCFSLGVKIPF